MSFPPPLTIWRKHSRFRNQKLQYEYINNNDVETKQSWASIIFSRHLVIQEPELLPDKTLLLLEYIPAWLASLKYYCIGWEIDQHRCVPSPVLGLKRERGGRGRLKWLTTLSWWRDDAENKTHAQLWWIISHLRHIRWSTITYETKLAIWKIFCVVATQVCKYSIA